MGNKTENLERDSYAIHVAAWRISCMLADAYTHRPGPAGVRLEAGPVEGWDDIVEVFSDGIERRWQVKRMATAFARSELLNLLRQLVVHNVQRATLALRTFVDVREVGPMRTYLRLHERARRTNNLDDLTRLAADLYDTEQPWIELLREAAGPDATVEDALRLAARFQIEALGDPEEIRANAERQLAHPLQHADLALDRLVSQLHSAPDGVLMHSPKTLRDGMLSAMDWRPELRRNAVRSTLPPVSQPLVGREELIPRILSALEDSPVALHGLPGVGKSRLAAELSKQQHDRHVVWWVDGSSPSSLVDGLISLGAALGITRAPSVSAPSLASNLAESREQLARVHAFLLSTPHWWIVVDNAAPPAELWPLLPRGPGGLLLTTLHGDWDTALTTLEVPPLVFSDSADWLIRMTGDTDRQAAEELARRLGGLPLALVQACAFARHAFPPRGRLKAYTELYTETESKILDHGTPPDHPISIVASVALIVDQLGADATKLLALLAALGTAPVPLERIAQQIGWSALHTALAFLDDRLRLASAIAELSKVALIAHHDDGLVMHRLVQSIVRQLTSEEREAIDATSCSIINVAVDRNAGVDSPLNQLLAPHILHLCDTSVPLDGHGAQIDLHILAGQYSMSLGQWAEARRYFQRALERSIHLKPDRHRSTIAWASFGLARLSLLNDRIHEAIDHGEAAEEVLSQHPGLKPDLRVKNLKCLIDCNIRLGRFDQARTMIAQLFEMIPSHDEAWTVEVRASVYVSQAQMALVESDFSTALAVMASARFELDQLEGSDPDEVGAHFVQLAQIYVELGRYEEALDVYESARAALEPSGATFAVGVAQVGIGTCRLELGDFAGAIVALEQSLATLRNAHPDGRHLNIASAEQELGRAYLANGQPELALEHCEAAVLKLEELDNVESRRVVYGLIELSRIYYALEDLPKALEAVDSALATYKKEHGSTPNLALCGAWHQRALVLIKLERPAEAATLLEQTLAMEEKLIGTTEQPSSARTRLLLAQAHLHMGRLDSARSHAVTALRVFRAGLPKGHPQIRDAATFLSTIETQYRQMRALPARESPRRAAKKDAPRSRNSPCPCGSGTKYKRCCAPDARLGPNDVCSCGSGKKHKRCCGR
jgi:tetratricopeptide (TPR) repeat protein